MVSPAVRALNVAWSEAEPLLTGAKPRKAPVVLSKNSTEPSVAGAPAAVTLAVRVTVSPGEAVGSEETSWTEVDPAAWAVNAPLTGSTLIWSKVFPGSTITIPLPATLTNGAEP